jgi:putative serine protease PepD
MSAAISTILSACAYEPFIAWRWRSLGDHAKLVVMSPKHLWSGDWRAETEAEAEERRRLEAEREATAVRNPDPGGQSAAPGAAAPPRRRGLFAASAAVVILAIGGGAFAAGSLLGGSDTKKSGSVSAAPLPASASKPVTPQRGQTRAGAIYAQASPAVVSIRTDTGTGTGFLVDNNGTLVTNDHVVDQATTVTVRFGTDGRTIKGDVRGTDPSSDLAVVHIDPASMPADAKPLKFADSDGVRVGDVAIAIGNPFGLDRTATEGIVSSLGRTIQAPNGFQIDGVIQTDAAINPGNSGGPLLDDGGLVIGVTSQIATSGGNSGNVGIGFAVPSNTVRQVLPGLEQGKTVSHAWLGVETGPVSSGAPGGGAQIASVVPGGPAAGAGLQPGDIVTAIDGKGVNGPTDLSTVINGKAPGDHVSLTVQRGGSRQTLDAALRSRPARIP